MKKEEVRTIHSLDELQAFADEFVESIQKNDTKAEIVALQGDLGAGKTAFAKCVARSLEVSEHVTSPTFVILKSYDLNKNQPFERLVHIDAYRLEDETELEVLGWEEYINEPKNFILIEWPERVEGLFKNISYTKLSFKIIDEHTREIIISYK